jgi:tetratricopeptide (TPR) repeat protein
MIYFDTEHAGTWLAQCRPEGRFFPVVRKHPETHEPDDSYCDGGIMSSHLDYEINKELGECYLFMGELDKAEEYYHKAIGSNGVHPDPYLGLATIAVQRGDLDAAMGLYRKAADIDGAEKAYAGMGLVEMEKGSPKLAIEHLRRSLEKNPENLIALFGLVQAGHALGTLEDVLPFMTNYLTLHPENKDVRFSLAGCLAGLGRRDDSRAQLEQLLAIDPQNGAAQELMQSL